MEPEEDRDPSGVQCSEVHPLKYPFSLEVSCNSGGSLGPLLEAGISSYTTGGDMLQGSSFTTEQLSTLS